MSEKTESPTVPICTYLVCKDCRRPVSHLGIGHMNCGNCGTRNIAQVIEVNQK